jgi:hypothetical protein
VVVRLKACADRSAGGGSPIRFVPSLRDKRQELLKFEHVHVKLTCLLDAPSGDIVMRAWDRWSCRPFYGESQKVRTNSKILYCLLISIIEPH